MSELLLQKPSVPLFETKCSRCDDDDDEDEEKDVAAISVLFLSLFVHFDGIAASLPFILPKLVSFLSLLDPSLVLSGCSSCLCFLQDAVQLTAAQDSSALLSRFHSDLEASRATLTGIDSLSQIVENRSILPLFVVGARSKRLGCPSFRMFFFVLFLCLVFHAWH